MPTPAPQAHEEIKRLQGCINDLIGIQALPAIWSGMDARQIVNTLLDVLVRVLRLDFACAWLNGSTDGSRFDAVRIRAGPDPNGPLHDSTRLRVWLKGVAPTQPGMTANPIGAGEIAIAPFRLGIQDEIGLVVAAATRTDFPTEIEMVLLRVAVNQAVVWLQEARRLKHVEDRLSRSEARLAEGQKLSHTGNWGWNVSSGELIFSRETFFILGLDPEQPAPTFQQTMELIHPEDRPFADQILNDAIRNKKSYEFEAHIVLADRSIRYVRSAAQPLMNESGQLEFVGTLLDITDRKKTEQTLEAAQAQLAHMARVTTMGELAAASLTKSTNRSRPW